MYKNIIDNIIEDIKHKLINTDISKDNIDNLLTTYIDNQDISLTLIRDIIDKYKPKTSISIRDKELLHEYILMYIRYSIKIKVLTPMYNTEYSCKKTIVLENLNNIDKLVDKIISNHTDNQYTTVTNIEYLITKLKHTDNNLFLTIKLLLHNKLY